MPDQPHDDEDAFGKPTELPATETGSPSPTGSTEQIGPYHLLEKLGEGGMGEVWLAEQKEPVKRKVALKVIKQGMDTKQVVARFAAEKQALALMDHPAIAKVYDAGITPQGRPYFAMEYVQGVPITEHCDRHKLTNRERLDLFMQVCDGVQHAHQKAVIHRDLKPGNVLVSIQNDKPMPKIIDFGVAKATAQKLTEQTMHTQLGVMIGTPAYMSPEQAERTGQDIDTRTDVYALGVMLYELLVGALPFEVKELQHAGYEAMVRKIREDEPPKPSTRLSTLGEHSTQSAKHRRTELPALKRELAGDLDWITMRALEKDRTRRYSSPQDFAEDIQRYLTDQPVLASPPSAVYRAKKFGKRHTWGVATAAIGVLVLIAFGATMAAQAKRVATERDVAQQVFGDEHVDTLNSMSALAWLYLKQGRYDEAVPLYLETLKARKRVLGDDDPNTLWSMNNLANLYNEMGRGDDARPLVAELLSSQRKRAEASSEADASNRYAWAALTCDPADLRDPRSALRFALDANEKTGYQNPSYRDTLSLAYHLTGDTAKAIENQRKAIALLPEGDSANRKIFEDALARFEAARDAEEQ